MGLKFPNTPPSDGDEPTVSPSTTQRTLLVADAAGNSRRLLVDANRRLLVSNEGAGLQISALATGTLTGVTDNVLTTIVTYTAPSAQVITKISCSGTGYAKFQLVLNTVTIETKRSGPGRDVVFTFEDPLDLSASDILDLKVIFFNTNETNNFEATIYGA